MLLRLLIAAAVLLSFGCATAACPDTVKRERQRGAAVIWCEL